MYVDITESATHSIRTTDDEGYEIPLSLLNITSVASSSSQQAGADNHSLEDKSLKDYQQDILGRN